MNKRWSLKDLARTRPFRMGRKPWVYGAIGLGSALLAVAVLILLFKGPIINGYGKRRLERAWATAHPGSRLQVGKLDYTLATGRLAAQAVTLDMTTLTLKADRVSLTGVDWGRLLLGRSARECLTKAHLDMADFKMDFPGTHYQIGCASVSAAVQDSELNIAGMVLQSTIQDEARFAESTFRSTRFHVLVPECRIAGLDFGGLLQGKTYRAQSVHLFRPALDALVNRDRPVNKSGKPPLMVNEALAAIDVPMQVDQLSITDGRIDYAERVVAGAAPGVLTFTKVKLEAQGIANRGGNSAAIRLKAQGKLMDAGELKVEMKIPLAGPNFSLTYAGSLDAMDLTRLNAFLDIAEHTHINSGRAVKVLFDVKLAGGRAHGQVRASYHDLNLAVLDKKTGRAKGLRNRLASFIANTFSIQATSAPGAMKKGKVSYQRRPGDTFIQIVWFSLRSGVLDVIHP